MFDFSPVQLLIVLAIALVILGPRKLPEMARSLGKGIREFKGSVTGEDDHRVVEAARHVEDDEAVALRQETPAPTPEIARAERAEAAGA